MAEKSLVKYLKRKSKKSNENSPTKNDDVTYIVVEAVGSCNIVCSQLSSFVDAVQASFSVKDGFSCDRLPKEIGFYILSVSLLENKDVTPKHRHLLECQDTFAIPIRGKFDRILRGSFKGSINAHLHGKEYTGLVEYAIRSVSIPGRETTADPHQLECMLRGFSIETTVVQNRLYLVFNQ